MTCRPLALRITVTSLLNTRSSSTSISNFHPCISSLYSSPILLCHTLSIFNFYYTDSEHTKLNMKEIMKLLLILIMIFDSQNLKRLEEENKSLYTEGTYMLTARTCSLYGHAHCTDMLTYPYVVCSLYAFHVSRSCVWSWSWSSD